MRLLVCGSRGWTSESIIRAAMTDAFAGTPNRDDRHMCVGDAQGADLIARRIAREFVSMLTVFFANWPYHSRAAGPIRNQAMLSVFEPQLCLAFTTNNDGSLTPGTADMVSRCRLAGVPVRVFTAAGEVKT